MLDDSLKAQLSAYLEKLRHPIELVASLDDSAKSTEVRELIRTIASLSPQVSVREDGDSARRPSFTIGRAGESARIRFAGVPLGHEFTSLVLALLQVGGHPPRVEESVLAQARALKGPFHFEVWMSLSCHNCPDVVQAVNLLAVQNPAVETTIIDGGVFPEEVESKGIMAVPMVFLNGEHFGQGRMSVEEIMAKLDSGDDSAKIQELNSRSTFDVLVVGGGPAGAAAAVYAARKGIRTGLVAERFGGQVLDTLGIENLISVVHTEGPKLAAALEEHVRTYDVDIMKLQRAQSIGRDQASGLVKVELANGAALTSRTVVLSTGARWRQMNVPGEAEYQAKGVCFCPHCDGPLFKGKRVAVIGGGNSGVEAAIDLAGIVSHVTLLEFDTQLRADGVLQDKLRSLSNVTIHTQAQTTEVVGDGQKVTGLRWKDRASGTEAVIELEGIFVQIGLLPNTDWLKGAVELSPRGEIVVNERGETSLPGVFAAGDATTTPYKQIVISVGDGAKASLSAFDYLIRHSN
jgi:alkyl hydroperoxide reductase subunit F